MSEFKSWRSYWNFERKVKQHNRYIRDIETDDFLSNILATSKGRERSVSLGTIFWRAQLGHEWEPLYQDDVYIDDMPAPYPPVRMRPISGKATEGRVNPKGIPYLYLASDEETAMAEVRPWIGSLVSAGQFKAVRNLQLVDCYIKHSDFVYYLKEPDPDKRERAVWTELDRAFAKPVNPSDHSADYVPTQIIAELFKTNGFDGIMYKSALGRGYNIVLFSLDDADLINCSLYEATQISFTFKQAANPYFVKKH